MNHNNDTKNDAYKSLFVLTKDKNSDRVRRIAIPHDVQFGLKDIPFDSQFFGRMALSTVVYDVNSVNKGALQIDNHATIASITASDLTSVEAITVSLPINPITGQVHFIKDASGIASEVSIDISSTSLIDGTSSLSLTTSHQSVILYWDGNTWHILSSSGGGGGGGGAPTDATYVTLTTNSNLTNERTLAAGTGVKLTDAGAGSSATLAINDSVVATLTGANFTGNVKFTSGLSGSLQQLTSGIPYLIGGSNASVVTQSNGQVVVSSIPLVPHLPAPDAYTLSQLTFVTNVTSSFGQLCVPVDAVNATPWTIDMVLGGYSRICPLGRSLYPQKQTSWRTYAQHVATGLEPTSALTMSTWITVPSANYVPNGETYGRVITKFHTTNTWQSGAYNVNGIWFVGTSLAFFLQTNGGSTTAYTEITDIINHIPPGTRALLTMTYVNNYMACYVNGAYVGGAIGSGNIFWGNSGQWVLGSLLPVSSYKEHFPGDIESFQLDNVARNADWIATYYKAGLGLIS